jgi:hypothetical protein
MKCPQECDGPDPGDSRTDSKDQSPQPQITSPVQQPPTADVDTAQPWTAAGVSEAEDRIRALRFTKEEKASSGQIFNPTEVFEAIAAVNNESARTLLMGRWQA